MGVCMDARNELKGKRGLVRLLNATRYSLAGYKAAWQDEEAFRQICLLAVIGLPLACWLGRDWGESVLLAVPLVFCLLLILLLLIFCLFLTLLLLIFCLFLILILCLLLISFRFLISL